MDILDRKHRGALAVVLAVVVLGAVLYPAYWTAAFAVFSLSGCFIECHSPDRLTGIGWASVAAGLLVLPVVSGMLLAGARRKTVLWASGGVALAVWAAIWFVSRGVTP